MSDKSSKANDLIYGLELVLKLIPVFLIIGAIYQIRLLYVFGINGEVFFSWSQVVSDTVALTPLFIPIFVSIWAGIFVMQFLEENRNSKSKERYNWILYIFLWLISGVVSSSVTGIIPLFIYGDFSWENIFAIIQLNGIIYFVGMVFFLSMKQCRRMPGIEKIAFWFTGLLLSFLVLYLLIPVYRDITFKNLCLWREGGEVIPVVYMNDRFAFFSGSIISDSVSTVAGTGKVVYPRGDKDRIIINCTKTAE